MNIEKLREQLINDEGYKLEVYRDTLGLLTFGIGHLVTNKDPEFYACKNLPNNGKLTVSKERVEEAFKKDITSCINDCHSFFKNFDDLPEEAQQIIANMMFNLGRSRFAKFEQFIKAINQLNFRKALQEMIASTWFKQTGDRSKRLAKRMEKVAADDLCSVAQIEKIKIKANA